MIFRLHLMKHVLTSSISSHDRNFLATHNSSVMEFAQEFLQISVPWPHLFLAYFQLFRQIWAPSLQLNWSKSVTLITSHFTSPSSRTCRPFNWACSHIRDVAWSSCCSFVIWDGSIYVHYSDKNERSNSCQLYFCIYKALILFWFSTQWRCC